MRAVNLIPSEQRSGQPVGVGRSQGGAYAVLVIVAGLALMAFMYGEARHQLASRRTQAATLTARAQQTQSAAERLAPYTSFIALREQRKQAVETLVASRFDWAHVMHEFGRVLPSQTSISSLSGAIASGSGAVARASAAPAGPAAPGAASAGAVASATPAGSIPTFTLAGCATSQSRVALTIERLRLIDGVREVTLENSTAGSSTGSTAGGGCAGHDAAFAMQITFDPLPSSTAVLSARKVADKTVSDAPSAGPKATSHPTSAPSHTTSGVTAR